MEIERQMNATRIDNCRGWRRTHLDYWFRHMLWYHIRCWLRLSRKVRLHFDNRSNLRTIIKENENKITDLSQYVKIVLALSNVKKK